MKPLELREADFKREVMASNYPQKLKQEFFDYWSEPDRAPKPKMRFEKEKTWHLGRRLSRWANNGFSKDLQGKEFRKAALIPDNSEIGKLDQFMEEYSKPGGADTPFDKFGAFYDLMKENKLLLKIDQQRANELLEEFGGDKQKCRCWCVQKTLQAYINSGLKIKDVIDLRKKLA
jgi:hypothetical protein